MLTRESLSIRALLAALALGIAGELLLRDTVWGINFPIFAVTTTGVGAYFWHRSNGAKARSAALLILPLLAFSLALALRDAPLLKGLNLAAAGITLGILVSRVRLANLGRLGLGDTIANLFAHWVFMFSDFWALILRDVKWKGRLVPGTGKSLVPALRGSLFAAPIIVVFGALLSSADDVFAQYAQSPFEMDLSGAFAHIGGAFYGAWFVGSIFRRMFVEEKPVIEDLKSIAAPPAHLIAPPPPTIAVGSQREPQKREPTFGLTEAAFVLGSLNVLLLAFVAIQIRYLFGGANVVSVLHGLTYSEYARKGFFELLTVVGLSMPLLVGVVGAFRDRGGAPFAVRILACLTVGLLFIVMASAFQRMGFYVEAYGLTQLRLYTTVFMGCLGLMLAWFLATGARNRTEVFFPGALASMAIGVFALNAMNPDALIARANLDRYARTKQIDAQYMKSLSADAVPVVAARLDSLPDPLRTNLAQDIRAKYGEGRVADWREWNLGQHQAMLAAAPSRR